jgi:hypothetical protein
MESQVARQPLGVWKLLVQPVKPLDELRSRGDDSASRTRREHELKKLAHDCSSLTASSALLSCIQPVAHAGLVEKLDLATSTATWPVLLAYGPCPLFEGIHQGHQSGCSVDLGWLTVAKFVGAVSLLLQALKQVVRQPESRVTMVSAKTRHVGERVI